MKNSGYKKTKSTPKKPSPKKAAKKIGKRK